MLINLNKLSLRKDERHTESISSALFLNFRISEIPNLCVLIFWIYIITTKHNNC